MYRYATYRYTTFRFHFRFHIFHCHVTYITMCDAPHAAYPIAMSPTSQYVMAPHATYSIAMSPTSRQVMETARHVSTSHHSLHRARNTCDLWSQFKYSRVIFQITLDEPLIDTSLQSLLQYLVFLPMHLPIFPFHLVESKAPLPLAYINPATSRSRDVGKREAAFFRQTTSDPSETVHRQRR
jgi:hypothetical protein